jgi:hypothetical protein
MQSYYFGGVNKHLTNLRGETSGLFHGCHSCRESRKMGKKLQLQKLLVDRIQESGDRRKGHE